MSSVHAIDANTLAYLKCLTVKDLLGLEACQFELGDFDAYLAETQQRYDLIRAIEYPHQDGAPPLPAEARVALAVMQLTGEGGPVDELSGLMNLRLAASNPHAQYVLARLATEGAHGVQKDPAAAQALMAAAARGGQPSAIAALNNANKVATQ